MTFQLIIMFVFLINGYPETPAKAMTDKSEFCHQSHNGEAKIKLETEKNKLKIKGVYSGAPLPDLSYKLSVRKKGRSGTSSNAQSGKFEVKPGQTEVILSSSAFGIQPNDQFFIQLQIYQDSKLVSEDILSFDASKVNDL